MVTPVTKDGGKTAPPDAASKDAAPPPPATADGGSDAAAPDASPDAARAATATQLAPGSVSIVGLTSDGWAIFRDGDALRAANTSVPGDVRDIAPKAGSVVIRGKVVFNWANVDYVANVGDLSIWTAAAGAHVIGSTQYAEGLIAASDAGDAIAYTANLNATTMDVVLAPSDLSSSQVVLKSVGRGSDTTCTASIGFVGNHFFAGSCAAGARSGSIQRFERGASGWQSTVLASGALPVWSADATGEKVFYQSENYAGEYVENEQSRIIDMGVSTGVMLPDGSAVLYTVNDQLRRTVLPGIHPIAIVTTGYSQPVTFSSSFHFALYSTTVTYDSGTKRDLRLSTTESFNATPLVLLAAPLATLARSSITLDEKFVLYLTDAGPTGGNLHVVTVTGTERAVIPGVVEAAATKGGTIVFTDNSSDPNQYPVVADLKSLDLAQSGAPRLLEAKVVDGKAFQVDASGTHIVYVRSGLDRDAGAARTGLFVKTLE
ncbi:MAG TPA: hypothetical protein VHU80_09860 [Polyangiaceae bacterium]|nr:hypothetical protein [Polyangiaceae bacterium]